MCVCVCARVCVRGREKVCGVRVCMYTLVETIICKDVAVQKIHSSQLYDTRVYQCNSLPSSVTAVALLLKALPTPLLTATTNTYSVLAISPLATKLIPSPENS